VNSFRSKICQGRAFVPLKRAHDGPHAKAFP
jgi:hypothetical protein